MNAGRLRDQIAALGFLNAGRPARVRIGGMSAA
jgi:hypothetical protein